MDASTPPPPQSEPLVLAKGMSFPNSKAALHFVQDVALAHNKRVKVASRGGNHRRVVCASADAGAADSATCPFFVQLYQHNSKTNRTWYVSSFELAHAPNCSSTGKPTQRQIAAMSQFQQALQQEPNATATQLLAKVEGVSGGSNNNIRTIYRAKQEIKHALLNRLHASYNEIPALLASFVTLNPGSLATYDVDDGDDASSEPSFITPARLFISCGVFTASASFNQQIYGLECVPFMHKQSRLKGVQLFLFGKDSNLETITLAAAVCDAASRANYKWFFTKVEQSGVKNVRVVPIFVAKDPHLLALEVELGLTLRFCTRSIIENDLAGFRGFKAHHHELIWGLQRSENKQQLNERLEWIRASCGSAIETYLRQQIPIERWVVAGNLHKVSLYGWRSRDFHEPPGRTGDAAATAVALKLIESLQDASLVTFLERVMAHFVKSAFERSTLAAKWRVSGQIVTERAAELYETQRKRSSEYDVTLASDAVAFVTRKRAFAFASSASSAASPLAQAQRRHRVDLGVNSCTCTFLDQFALPCRHLIAVLLASGSQQQSLESDTSRVYSNRFSLGYLVENFARAFEGKRVELPLANASLQPTTDERSLSSASNRTPKVAIPVPRNAFDGSAGATSSKKLKRSTVAASSSDSPSAAKRTPRPPKQPQEAQSVRMPQVSTYRPQRAQLR